MKACFVDIREGEFKRRRKENQILLQLALIVGSYLLGYITYSGEK